MKWRLGLDSAKGLNVFIVMITWLISWVPVSMVILHDWLRDIFATFCSRQACMSVAGMSGSTDPQSALTDVLILLTGNVQACSQMGGGSSLLQFL